jgi:hypothetical protein
MQTTEEYVIDFERFWAWLGRHANCIIEAGSPDFALFDHDDFHWQVAETPDGERVVQLVRGKDLVGEVAVEANRVLAVHAITMEPGRFRFDLVGAEADEALRYFVLAHAFDESKTHARSLQH